MKHQKAMSNLLDTVVTREEAPTTIVAYGDASFGPHGHRGEVNVPVQKHKRMLEKRCKGNIHYVDEYKTTLLCCECYSELKVPTLKNVHNASKKDKAKPGYNPEKTLRPHGLRHCKTAHCTNGGCVSRDGNAARNIRSFYIKRPKEACRPVLPEDEHEDDHEWDYRFLLLMFLLFLLLLALLLCLFPVSGSGPSQRHSERTTETLASSFR